MLAIQMEHNQAKGKGKKSGPVNVSIDIYQPFYPLYLSLRNKMDEFVHSHLSLQMRSTDGPSNDVDLVHLASLAGGYLTLMYTAMEVGATGLSGHHDRYSDVDDHAAKHIVKFSLLRFDALLEYLIGPLRRLGDDNWESNDCANIVAAAGVLYCEVEYTYQGCLSGKLKLICADQDLEQSVRAWLKTIAQELLPRLCATCGRFPVWAENLVPPIKGAKRTFGIRNMSIEIQTLQSLQVPDQWTNYPSTARSSVSSSISTGSSVYATPRPTLENNSQYRSEPDGSFTELIKGFEEAYPADGTSKGVQYSTVGATSFDPFQKQYAPYLDIPTGSNSNTAHSNVVMEPLLSYTGTQTFANFYQDHDGLHLPSLQYDSSILEYGTNYEALLGRKILVTPPSPDLPPVVSTSDYQSSIEQPFQVTASSYKAVPSGPVAFDDDLPQEQSIPNTSSLYCRHFPC